MNKALRNYGIIGGLIGTVFFVGPIAVSPEYYLDPAHFENGEVVGYSVMFLSMVPVFLGVRAYRNKYYPGLAFSFSKGLVSGLIITGIATLVFYLGNIIIYEIISPGFLEEFSHVYYDYMLQEASDEIAKASIKANFNSMEPFIKNGFLYGLLMSVQVLMFGLIISLISALSLKRG